jgi:hypothetical protein
MLPVYASGQHPAEMVLKAGDEVELAMRGDVARAYFELSEILDVAITPNTVVVRLGKVAEVANGGDIRIVYRDFKFAEAADPRIITITVSTKQSRVEKPRPIVAVSHLQNTIQQQIAFAMEPRQTRLRVRLDKMDGVTLTLWKVAEAIPRS